MGSGSKASSAMEADFMALELAMQSATEFGDNYLTFRADGEVEMDMAMDGKVEDLIVLFSSSPMDAIFSTTNESHLETKRATIW